MAVFHHGTVSGTRGAPVQGASSGPRVRRAQRWCADCATWMRRGRGVANVSVPAQPWRRGHTKPRMAIPRRRRPSRPRRPRRPGRARARVSDPPLPLRSSIVPAAAGPILSLHIGTAMTAARLDRGTPALRICPSRDGIPATAGSADRAPHTPWPSAQRVTGARWPSDRSCSDRQSGSNRTVGRKQAAPPGKFQPVGRSWDRPTGRVGAMASGLGRCRRRCPSYRTSPGIAAVVPARAGSGRSAGPGARRQSPDNPRRGGCRSTRPPRRFGSRLHRRSRRGTRRSGRWRWRTAGRPGRPGGAS